MNKKTALGYFVLFVFSCCLFLVLAFPGERLAARLNSELNQPGTPVKADIERVSFVLPFFLNLENTRIVLANNTEILPEELKIKITPGLLFSEEKEVRFTSRVNGGEISGTVPAGKGGQAGLADASIQMDGIKIDQYRYNTRIADITLSCSISGEYKEGQGNFKLSGFESRLRRSLLNRLKIPKVDFTSVDVDFLKEERVIHLKQLKARGPVININLKGEITPGKNASDSRLSLTGSILSDSPYLARLANSAIIRSMVKKAAAKDGIHFSINGTLEQPRISL